MSNITPVIAAVVEQQARCPFTSEQTLRDQLVTMTQLAVSLDTLNDLNTDMLQNRDELIENLNSRISDYEDHIMEIGTLLDRLETELRRFR